MSIVIGSGFLLVVVIGVLFLYLSPEFGGAPTMEQKRIYIKSPNNRDG